MSEEMIVRHCSPTLAGLKTGSMFTCAFPSATHMKQSLRQWNKILLRKGLRVLPLRFDKGRALIYIYRPSALLRDLDNQTAHRILSERGYEMLRPEKCVGALIERMRESAEFPHEIGLFLGYPPEDVSGFIENGAEGAKYIGCWKVYSDVGAAQALFEKYKKCTDSYSSQLKSGVPIERLIVSKS